jgi:hypothetical protein
VWMEGIACRRSTIRSVGNRSGKMSVDERTDIDYERADKVVHHECGVGTAVERQGGGTASWGE